MKKILFLLVIVLMTSVVSYSAKYTVGYQGYSFKPAALNIQIGDTVVFELSSYHNAVEVSQATYEANGNTSDGGFEVPYGGGTVVFDTQGTYYYVCTPHAMYGMKGIIHVTGPASSNANEGPLGGFVLSPNPTSGFFNLNFTLNAETNVSIDLMDISGALVSHLSNEMLGIGSHSKTYLLERSLSQGIYFIVLKTESGMNTYKIIVQ